MDLKTLWHRANEAIDTIIRRDEAPETDGDLLQPCIEGTCIISTILIHRHHRSTFLALKLNDDCNCEYIV